MRSHGSMRGSHPDKIGRKTRKLLEYKRHLIVVVCTWIYPQAYVNDAMKGHVLKLTKWLTEWANISHTVRLRGIDRVRKFKPESKFVAVDTDIVVPGERQSPSTILNENKSSSCK